MKAFIVNAWNEIKTAGIIVAAFALVIFVVKILWTVVEFVWKLW